MKVKGISPIEQNVDKIVLGVAGAALLGVVAMQVVSSSQIKVNNQDHPLERAYQPVREEALRVTAQMSETNPTLPEVPVVDLLGAYRTEVSRPVAVRPQIPTLGPRLALATAAAVEEAPVGDAVYAAIRVPAPSTPLVYAFRSTINPEQVARNPEIAAIVPVSQPHDKAAVTIEATFNGQALQELLRRDPDGAGPARALPLRWWQDAVEIIAVQAERQTLLAGGTWSAPQSVRPMPGALDLMAVPAGDERFNPVNLRTTVSRARQLWQQVQRPQYLSVLAGRPWIPPSAAATMDSLESRRPEIDRLRAQRRALQRQIRTIEAQIEQGPETGRPTQTTQPSGPETPRPPTTPTTNPTQPRPEDPQILALRGRLQQANAQLTANEAALAAIGVGLDGLPIATWERSEESGYAAPMLDDPRATLWVHDLHVEPGATYRYRTRVVVNNPFFGNGAALTPDQQSLAAEPFIIGDWTPWSAETHVEPDRYYFITAAGSGDGISRQPNAQVEVFQFYYGFWRRGTANISTGDVVAARVELPAPELRPIYDLTQAPGTPAPGATQPPPPRRQPDDFTPVPETSRGGPRPPQPAGPGAQPIGPPPGTPAITGRANPGPKPEDFPPAITDAILLDVTTQPGALESSLGTRTLIQAVLSSSRGLEVRLPDMERAGATYRRLRASSEAGMRQGAPEPEPEEPEIIRPEPERREPTTPAPSGGGGGGGGGG